MRHPQDIAREQLPPSTMPTASVQPTSPAVRLQRWQRASPRRQAAAARSHHHEPPDSNSRGERLPAANDISRPPTKLASSATATATPAAARCRHPQRLAAKAGGKRHAPAYATSRRPPTPSASAIPQPMPAADWCHSRRQAPPPRQRSQPPADNASDERVPPAKHGSHRAQSSRSSATAPLSPAGAASYQRRQAQPPSQNQRPPAAKTEGKSRPRPQPAAVC